jgi:hypothetical protein
MLGLSSYSGYYAAKTPSNNAIVECYSEHFRTEKAAFDAFSGMLQLWLWAQDTLYILTLAVIAFKQGGRFFGDFDLRKARTPQIPTQRSVLGEL